MTHSAIDFFARRGRAVWSLLLFIAALMLLAALDSGSHFQFAPDELGPRFWPRICLTIMLLLTAFDASLSFWKARKQPAHQVETSAAFTTKAPASMPLLLAGIVLVILYAVATVLVGFALATLLFLAAFSYLGGYRRIPRLLLIAFGTTLALLYIFVFLVYISLPLGQGPFLDMNVALYRLLGLY